MDGVQDKPADSEEQTVTGLVSGADEGNAD